MSRIVLSFENSDTVEHFWFLWFKQLTSNCKHSVYKVEHYTCIKTEV